MNFLPIAHVTTLQFITWWEETYCLLLETLFLQPLVGEGVMVHEGQKLELTDESQWVQAIVGIALHAVPCLPLRDVSF